MKKRNSVEIKLDDEELEISEAFDQALEQDTLKNANNLKEEMVFAREAAANYARKDTRLNIRISNNDLARLKQKSAYKGLPYQTFIASVLHEYAAGQFEI